MPQVFVICDGYLLWFLMGQVRAKKQSTVDNKILNNVDLHI